MRPKFAQIGMGTQLAQLVGVGIAQCDRWQQLHDFTHRGR